MLKRRSGIGGMKLFEKLKETKSLVVGSADGGWMGGKETKKVIKNKMNWLKLGF